MPTMNLSPIPMVKRAASNRLYFTKWTGVYRNWLSRDLDHDIQDEEVAPPRSNECDCPRMKSATSTSGNTYNNADTSQTTYMATMLMEIVKLLQKSIGGNYRNSTVLATGVAVGAALLGLGALGMLFVFLQIVIVVTVFGGIMTVVSCVSLVSLFAVIGMLFQLTTAKTHVINMHAG